MREEADNDNPEKRVTLRDIARKMGVSHVSVSAALRGAAGVSKERAAAIRAKADEMGYRPDPMLATLSSYRKNSKTKPIHATLAWLNTWPRPGRLRQHREFDHYWEGAADNARRLGFHLEAFNLAEIPPRRLNTIFKTRNIRGVLLPPARAPNDALRELDWSNLAAVRFGQSIPYPKTHLVTSAQMANTMLAFDRARELGYKRIGFVCEFWRSRFFGVGYSWAQKNLPKNQQLPILALDPADAFEKQQVDFEKWIVKTNPDAILTDNSEPPRMLENLGHRVPDDIGVATTSVHDTEIDAGLDQRPHEIGRAAVRVLNGLIAENSFGIPDCVNETLVEGRWVDGPMLPVRAEATTKEGAQ